MISRAAAQVMSLAQGGDAVAARELAQATLREADGAPAPQRAALWYALAVAHHSEGEYDAQGRADRPLPRPGPEGRRPRLAVQRPVDAGDGPPARGPGRAGAAGPRPGRGRAAGCRGRRPGELGPHRPRLRLPRAAALRAGQAALRGGRRPRRQPGAPRRGPGHRPAQPGRAARAVGRRARAGPAARRFAADEADELRSTGHDLASAAFAEADGSGRPASRRPPARSPCAPTPRARAAASLAELRAACESPDHTDHHGRPRHRRHRAGARAVAHRRAGGGTGGGA